MINNDIIIWHFIVPWWTFELILAIGSTPSTTWSSSQAPKRSASWVGHSIRATRTGTLNRPRIPSERKHRWWSLQLRPGRRLDGTGMATRRPASLYRLLLLRSPAAAQPPAMRSFRPGRSLFPVVSFLGVLIWIVAFEEAISNSFPFFSSKLSLEISGWENFEVNDQESRLLDLRSSKES